MDLKVAVAAGLSFLTFAYWQKGSKPTKVWTFAGISGKAKSMLERRSQLLRLEATEGEWDRDKRLCQMLSEASETELLEFQLACAYLDLQQVLGVDITDPERIWNQLTCIQNCLSDGLNARDQLWAALEQVQALRNESTQNGCILAQVLGHLRQILSIDVKDTANIESQLFQIRNGLIAGISAEENLHSANAHIQALTEEKKALIHEYTDKLRKVEALYQTSRDCTAQRDSLSQSLSASQQSNKSLQEQFSRLQSHSKSLTDKYTALKSEKDSQDKTLIEQRKALERRNEEAEEKRKRQSETWEKERGRLHEENKSLKREVRDVAESQRASIAEQEELIRRLKEEHLTRKRDLEGKLSNLNLQIAALTGQSHALELTNEKLQADLRNAKSDYSDFYRAFDIVSTERDSLEKRLSACSLDLTNLKSECSNLRALREAVLSKDQQCAEVTRRLEAKELEMQQTVQALRAENANQSDALANTHSQLKQILGVDSAHMEEQLVCIRNSGAEGNSAKAELQDALEDIQELREAKRVQIRDFAAKQREYEQLLESFRECSNQRDALSQSLAVSQRSTTNLQEQLERLLTDLTSSQSRLQSLTEKHSNLKSLKDTQDRKVEEQRKTLAQVQPISNENIALRQSLNDAKKLIKGLEKAKLQLGKEKTFLEKEVDSGRAIADEQNRQIKRVKEENASMQQMVNDLNQRITLLQAQIHSLGLEKETLQINLQKAKNDCLDYSNDCASLEKQLSVSTFSNAKLQAECGKSREELLKAQQSADQFWSEKSTWCRQLSELMESLNKQMKAIKDEALSKEQLSGERIQMLQEEQLVLHQTVREIRDGNSQKSRELAGLYEDLKQVLDVQMVDCEGVREQLVAIGNSVAEGKALREGLQSALGEIQDLRKAEKVHNLDYIAKQRECEVLLQSLQDSYYQIDALSNSMHSQKALQEQVEILKSELTGVETRLQSLTEKHSNLKSLKEAQDKKVEEQRKTLAKFDAATNENKALKRSLEELKRLNGTLELSKSALRKENEVLAEEVDGLKEEVRKSVKNGNASAAEKDCQIKRVNEENQSMQQIVNSLNQQIACLQEQNHSLGLEKETLQADLRKAQSDSLDYYRAFEIISSDCTSLEQQLSTSSKLQTECEKLREDLHKVQQSANQYSRDNSTLCVQLLELREARDQQVKSLREELLSREQQGAGEIRTLRQELQQTHKSAECVVCLEGVTTVLLQPCRHLCLCKKCAKQTRTECPICRTPITSKTRVFLP